jgi:acyl-CoA synthetase (AMP-forming)/AMP-acid ligase II
MALTERYQSSTVASALAHHATADPQRNFLVFRDEVFTCGQIESQAEALAAALHGLGIQAGDRIALLLPAWPEFVVSMFAAAKLGVVIVPLNPRLTTPELQYMLRHSEAVAAVTVESYHGVDFLQLFEDLLVQLPDLRYLITVGKEDLWYDDRIFQFEDLISSGSGRDFPSIEVDADQDLFAILYTSGTTGKPKGVGLTHRSVLHATAGTVEAIDLRPEDRVIGVTALFHVFGMGPGILGSLLSGSSLVLQDEFDAAGTLDLVQKYGITVQYGIPTLFVTELHEQLRAPRDLSTLRLGVAAGAPMAEELMREVQQHLCPTLLVAYSLTETSSTVCITRPGDSPEKRRFTVGTPLSGTEIKVLERDGTVLPVESVGEIAIKGPGVMRGYYRQPIETQAAFNEDGYFLSGDLGIIDEDGYIHLVGRRKEVIIRSGFNVYPREVEDRLQAHPAVLEAAVVGVPDEVLGEAICACVVPIEGAIVTGQEIKDWCRMTLADYKIPDLVRFLDEFPLTATGKIRRVELSRMIQTERPSQRS